MLYCEGETFWRHEVANKHHTEGSGKATPPVCRYTVDPHQFDSERHMTKRHPLAYLPFGAGPRHCAGMRFALLGLKMACVRLLKEFTVLPSDKLKNSFCILEASSVVPKAVWIRLERRKKI